MKHNVKLLSTHGFGQIFAHNISEDITDETLSPRVMGNSRTLVMDGTTSEYYKPGGNMRRFQINPAVVKWRQRSLKGICGEPCPCVADSALSFFSPVYVNQTFSIEEIQNAPANLGWPSAVARAEFSRIDTITRPYSPEELQNSPRFRLYEDLLRPYSPEELQNAPPNPCWTTPR